MIENHQASAALPAVADLLAAYPQLSELKTEHLQGAARAFVTLSPDYFLSAFGVPYLARTFWGVFCDEPDCFGFVWLDDGQVVGFVGGTCQRDRFIPAVIRRSPAAFLGRLIAACVRTPSFLAHGLGLFLTVRQERARSGPDAELISLGVLPGSRRPVIGLTGSEVSPAKVLLAAAASRLRARGLPAFRLYTGASNRLACGLYRRLGFREAHRLQLFSEEKICFVAPVDAPGLAL